jgi:BirA family biotin operon repressor/biotin-[acetyl-CoA-carboxylase] ligase
MDTLFTGRHIVELDTIPSTNTHAMQLIKDQKAVEGTLVWAHFQSSGRGQAGNTWQSEKGENLTFSLVLHPSFLVAEQQFFLSKIASLAVLGALTELLPASQYDIRIKWPNDILVNGQKIAGILIENLLRGNYLQSSVIGLGLNVNQESFGELAKATSLAKLTGHKSDLRTVLGKFCRHFEALYLSLKRGRFEQLTKLYTANLYLLNEPAKFKSGDELFEGIIIGVTESGLLGVKTAGKILEFNFKEIVFLPQH